VFKSFVYESSFREVAMASQPRFDLWILRSLRRIMRAVDVQSHRLAAEYAITGPQVVCLQTIAEDGPLTATALAKLVHLGNSTVVGILDRLEHKGLVARERSAVDRRHVLVHATAAGRDLLARVPSPLQDRLAAGLARLPEKEQLALAAATERICELLEVPDFGAAPLLESRPIEESLPARASLPTEGDAHDHPPRRPDAHGSRDEADGPGRAPGRGR
jgi:DNA-binding MarR family transcriptional regulator